MRNLIYILALITGINSFSQDFHSTGGDIGPSILSFKKYKQEANQSPCEVIFNNFLNVDLQVNYLMPNGRMQKLYFIPAKGTVKFKTITNHHLIVCFQGQKAGVKFIPYTDVNVCNIHEKYFTTTQSIPRKCYKPVKSDTRVDKRFKYKPKTSTYGLKGPKIFFDEGHLTNNSINGYYKPFADMLRKDGYEVSGLGRNQFTEENLKQAKILIISNAFAQQINGWVIDSAQAFSTQEVSAIKNYVKNGGSLLLISDHVPYPSRIKNLSKAFNFEIMNAHAIDTSSQDHASLFSKELETLGDNIITKGRNTFEEVKNVYLFQGCALKKPKQAKQLFKLSDKFNVVYTDNAWDLQEAYHSHTGEGYSLGFYMNYGKGKLMVVGDADLFTATKNKKTKQKFGFSYPYAKDNPQYVLNMIHWLDGFIED